MGVNSPAAAVLVVAAPGDDKVAAVVHGDAGKALLIGRGGVDGDLPRLSDAAGIEEASQDFAIAAGRRGPDNDEVSGTVHRHRCELLIRGGIGVDQDLAALCHARGVELLCINSPAGAVLQLA